jgi:AraC-like DNA-binding protein
MSTLKISSKLKTSSIKEMNEYSTKLGWDVRYLQVGAGIFSGEFQEGVSPSIIVTREHISVPVSIKGGAVPGYFGLGMCLSTEPAKINGQDLQPPHLIIIKPGAEFEFVSKGPEYISVALIPEFRFEEILGDSFGTIIKSIENVRVFSKEVSDGAECFKNWLQIWPSHSLWQNDIGSEALTHQLDEIIYAFLDDITDNLKKKAGGRDANLVRSKKHINRLIDYFHCHPEQSVSTEDMCRVAGLSRRSLFYNFKEYSGFTPYNYFKFIRLALLHRELLGSSQNVTNLAVKYNFLHLGEFSALYKNTYGELPSDTQKRSLTLIS